MQDRGPAACVAEFVGTLLLVFFITTAVSVFLAQSTPQNPNPSIGWSVIGLVHVFVLFAPIQSHALASGAHFDPAVTLALAGLRQIKPPDALVYIVAQLAGAVAGALLTKLLTEFDNADQVNFGAPAVGDRLGGEVGLGKLAEFIGAFFLVWAIVGVAVNPSAARNWAARAIGAALGMGGSCWVR